MILILNYGVHLHADDGNSLVSMDMSGSVLRIVALAYVVGLAQAVCTDTGSWRALCNGSGMRRRHI